MGCFESVTLLSAGDLGTDYWSACGDFVRTHPRRGFGFWSWKPYIIHRHLASLPEGEVLLYVDAGFSMSGFSAPDVVLTNYAEYVAEHLIATNALLREIRQALINQGLIQ